MGGIVKDINKRKIRDYVFEEREVLKEEEKERLSLIYISLAREIKEFLNGEYRIIAEVRYLGKDEQLPFREFLNLLSKPPLVMILKEEKLDVFYLVDINLQLGFNIIERLLGGKGDMVALTREPTQLELKLLSDTAEKLLNIINKTWALFSPLRFKLLKLEADRDLLKGTMNLNESVMNVPIEVKINDTLTAVMNFCTPIYLLSEAFSLIHTLKAAKKIDEKKLLQQHMETTQVEVVAELGRMKIKFGEVIDLNIKDVINLKKDVREEISVYVGGVERFRGIIGKVRNKKLGIKITKVL